ncbi:ABC transporter permease [Halorubrum ezzemoulense]|uniref:ABC transporter permease n=1 Tax=Halorubrum ezzemoulense TaxID=337243 RepID=UPI002330F71A|nr:ABC transporter permease [Halorubrum ezzemoulense]MDB2282676.1 ABC transporter permease [Halorubrum ezzemoulense]
MLERFRAVIGLAAVRVRRDRSRTVLAVCAVALAVLAVTMLGSLGLGVVDTGQQKFESADRDLWVSGGPLRIAPGTVGGFQGGIVDAHATSRRLSSSSRVDTASPLLFQTIYVGRSPDSLRTVVGVGATSSAGFQVRGGDGFGRDAGFYNAGGYNGTASRKVVLGDGVRSDLGVDVGETVYLGGTTSDARRTQYTVVGTSPTFSRFLGADTAALPLAELQAMTGNAHTDRASIVTLDVAADSDVTDVKQAIQADYPEYTVRTNAEQLESIIGNRILLVAAGLVLTVVSVVAGAALSVNLLSLLVAQEQTTIASLRALGLSRHVVAGVIATQGLYYGLLGAVGGLVMTVPFAGLLNRVVASLFGFDTLVQVSPWVVAAGAMTAFLAGGLTAILAGWRASGVEPLAVLER